ncbi:MAG TPA: flavin oxidoreductase [Microbacterium sp.]|nr:flavin oxidoreductase [Microbacterium sp.]
MDIEGATSAGSTEHDSSRPASAEAFKDAFRRHPGGVSVVTADAGAGPVALTLTSVASVSADPPLLVFSVSEMSSATPTILAADTIVVHLIDSSGLGIAQLAATHGADRFAGVPWERLPTGEPRYSSVPNWLRCRIIERVPAGGSAVIVALVLETGDPGEVVADPLTYHNRTWHRLGTHSAL